MSVQTYQLLLAVPRLSERKKKRAIMIVYTTSLSRGSDPSV